MSTYPIKTPEFQKYVSEADRLISVLHTIKDADKWSLYANKLLDGALGTELRRNVEIEILRNSGIFFTDSRLRNEIMSMIEVRRAIRYLDPACGIGDLLIACAMKVGRSRTINETINDWGTVLHGFDIFPEFVDLAKQRLVILAMFLHESQTFEYEKSEIFPNIKAVSFLEDDLEVETFDCVVMNPPYNLMNSPSMVNWASGKVNSAAVFLERCLKFLTTNGKIIAVLPDVLRSGSRYQAWREQIQNQLVLEKVILCGQFDSYTDVDVFIAQFKRTQKSGQNQPQNWQMISRGKKSVGDYFEVRVGPVVNYRDPHKGKWRKFLVARDLPQGKSIFEIPKSRRFLGRVFSPPFVVVQRTSRKEDRFRLRAAIIRGNREVAVENHLLVLVPKDGRLSTCSKLLNLFGLTETNEWMNQRIRCRHLTVSSVMDLPWRVSDD
ncbi:MAG: hypothetical protein EPO32_00970 [Anaerolineae bacterium]|nr:MAG: hypothetical protein EPO32_00970 [Anaerolineae bacterium]